MVLEEPGMKLRAAILVVLALWFLWSNPSWAAKKNVAVSLERREVLDMTSTGLVLVFYLKVLNSTASSYYLEQVDHRAVIQEKDYFSMRTSLDEPIFVPTGAETLISLPVKITYALLFEHMPGIEKEDRIRCYVTGVMMFTDGRRVREKVPFAFSGEFPLFRDLELEIASLRIKDLSLGGAEFIFTCAWKNPNGFDLDLDMSIYQLRIGGRMVGEWRFGAGESIESRGEKRVSLPVVQDFFEVGRELQAILEQPAAECELAAELEAGSIWGKVKVAVSKSETVAIQKKSDGLDHHPHL